MHAKAMPSTPGGWAGSWPGPRGGEFEPTLWSRTPEKARAWTSTGPPDAGRGGPGCRSGDRTAGGWWWPAPGRTLKAENLAAIHARAAASIAPPTLRPPPCSFPARRVVHGRSRGGQRSPPPCRGNEAGRPPAMAQDLAGVVVDAAR